MHLLKQQLRLRRLFHEIRTNTTVVAVVVEAVVVEGAPRAGAMGAHVEVCEFIFTLGCFYPVVCAGGYHWDAPYGGYAAYYPPPYYPPPYQPYGGYGGYPYPRRDDPGTIPVLCVSVYVISLHFLLSQDIMDHAMDQRNLMVDIILTMAHRITHTVDSLCHLYLSSLFSPTVVI